MDYLVNGIVVEKSEASVGRRNKTLNAYMDLIMLSNEVRQSSGITQTQIAKVLGVNQDKISNYESGKVSPRLDLYLRYLDALGYTLKIVPKEGE